MEERRLLLAVALSFLLLTAYRLYFLPPPATKRSPAPAPAAASPAPAATSPAPAATSPAPAAVPSAASVPAASRAALLPTVTEERERRVEVVSRDLTAAFTNRGARLLSWQLGRYRDGRGRPEEMVQTPPGGPRPLDIETGDPEVDRRLRDALYRCSAENLTVPASAKTTTLSFEYAEGDLLARKAVRFAPTGYEVGLSVSVLRGGRDIPKTIVWGPGIGNASPEEKAVQGYEPPQAVILGGAGVERIRVEKMTTPRTLPDVRWAGVESRYFAALIVPPGGHGAAEVRGESLPPTEDGKMQVGPVVAVGLDGGEPAALLYVGPKDYGTLERVGHEFARVVPVGDWIGPIVVAFMDLLGWVHIRVGSYGWSIVVLTVLINLVMSPLRHYGIVNSQKMAKLSPEMRVIQDRYRKVPALDPKRQDMQKEIAALYERHGLSMGTQMAVGCLPLLLTLPFLAAIYKVLSLSIELRGASFLWIPDLSHRDPLLLTPGLMGASMFLMQRMTPSAMDPAQQRMMMMMPLVFAVMFFAAPAGLNLYWLTSNLCAILQQVVTLRIIRSGEESGGRREKARRRR